MTFYVTALTNDKARLIVNETRTTSIALARLVQKNLKDAGYLVVTREEA